jgi:hypothetical protein
VAIATDMVKACIAQDWDRAYAQADVKFVRGFTEFMNAQAWTRVKMLCGNLKSIGKAQEYRHLLGPIRTVFLDCQFERLLVVVEVSFTLEDRIVGLAMRTPGFA